MLNLCCLVSKIWLLLRLALQWAEERAEGSDPVLLQPVPGAGFLSAGGDRSRCGQGQHLSPANFGCLLNSLRAAAGPAGGPGMCPSHTRPTELSPWLGGAGLLQCPDSINKDLLDSEKTLVQISERPYTLFFWAAWVISSHQWEVRDIKTLFGLTGPFKFIVPMRS